MTFLKATQKSAPNSQDDWAQTKANDLTNPLGNQHEDGYLSVPELVLFIVCNLLMSLQIKSHIMPFSNSHV